MPRRQRTLVEEPTGAGTPTGRWLARLGGSIAPWLSWFTTCRAYWRAALRYEQLSRLPEAELNQLGYTRATLARDVTGFDVTQHPNSSSPAKCAGTGARSTG